ncbi:MAG: hypothetical protein ACKVLA_18205 [Rhodobacterales bacterium]
MSPRRNFDVYAPPVAKPKPEVTSALQSSFKVAAWPACAALCPTMRSCAPTMAFMEESKVLALPTPPP